MPLSPARTWSYSLFVPSARPPVAKKKKNQPISYRDDLAIGVLGGALIAGFFAQVPIAGLAVGGACAAAIYRYATSTSAPTSAPAPPLTHPSPAAYYALTLGADGMRVMGLFYPWRQIRKVSVGEGLCIEFFAGWEQLIQAEEPVAIADHAKRRMQWGQQVPGFPLSSSSGGYRGIAQPTYSHGVPLALRANEPMATRLRDYQHLDPETKLQVLHAMADLRTRSTFLNASEQLVRRRWLARTEC